MIDSYLRFKKLLPQNILVSCSCTRDTAVNSLDLLTFRSELLFQSCGKETFNVNLPAFYERVPEKQNPVVIIRRLAIMVVKSEIVYLNPIRILIVVHESDMRFEFGEVVVEFKDRPGMAEMERPNDYFPQS